MNNNTATSHIKSIAPFHLKRRGFDLGEVRAQNTVTNNDKEAWQQGKSILLKQVCLSELAAYAVDIAQSKTLYKAIIEQKECDPILAESPYAQRIDKQFEPLGSVFNEGEKQEIETVLFDVINPDNPEQIIAEDLWMKISWLSFIDADKSLRFRFSFGEDFIEDVAADPLRQHYAAILTEAVFPESQLITRNKRLHSQLNALIGCEKVNFVERIVYYNAPNGGAYLHHDQERGHAGVVYAQITGSTFWLALPKYQLVQEIVAFIGECELSQSWTESITPTMQAELLSLTEKPSKLADELDSFANDTLIHLINETQGFVQWLIKQGHSQIVHAGDMLLLPQEKADNCCWHSVFTMGETTGQSLSFAVRGD